MKELLTIFFNEVIKAFARDNPKTPVDSFRMEFSDTGGKLYAPDWFKYLIYGRGPGKQPPPNAMLDWVRKNPRILQDIRSAWPRTTEKGAAYIIGRKIGREGTAIFRGERKGIDFNGAIENSMPDFLKSLGQRTKLEIVTSLQKAIK